MKSRRPPPTPCPCGRAADYARCCSRYHAGENAPDAETLMRARYSAYVKGLADYLLATWSKDTRPTSLDLDETPRPQWLALDVKRHEPPHADGATATVEFVARYRIAGRAYKLHETSRFLREDDRWVYYDGVIEP